MPRQIQIVVACDNCGATGLDPDHALVLAVAADKPRQLDLCDKCLVSVWGPVAKLYADAPPTPELSGAPKQRRRRRTVEETGGAECPECGAQSATWSGVRQHLAQVHDINVGQWQAEHGHALGHPDVAVPHVCDVCGGAFTTPTSLGSHRTKAHP